MAVKTFKNGHIKTAQYSNGSTRQDSFIIKKCMYDRFLNKTVLAGRPFKYWIFSAGIQMVWFSDARF
jgi:hypothetical protein